MQGHKNGLPGTRQPCIGPVPHPIRHGHSGASWWEDCSDVSRVAERAADEFPGMLRTQSPGSCFSTNWFPQGGNQRERHRPDQWHLYGRRVGASEGAGCWVLLPPDWSRCAGRVRAESIKYIFQCEKPVVFPGGEGEGEKRTAAGRVGQARGSQWQVAQLAKPGAHQAPSTALDCACACGDQRRPRPLRLGQGRLRGLAPPKEGSSSRVIGSRFPVSPLSLSCPLTEMSAASPPCTHLPSPYHPALICSVYISPPRPVGRAPPLCSSHLTSHLPSWFISTHPSPAPVPNSLCPTPVSLFSEASSLPFQFPFLNC